MFNWQKKKIDKIDEPMLKSAMSTLRSYESISADKADSDEIAVSEAVLIVNEKIGFKQLDHAIYLSQVLGSIESRYGDNNMHISAAEMEKGMAQYEGDSLEYLQKVKAAVFG